MDDRELRDRLQKIDPVASGEVRPVADEKSQMMLEKIMNESVNESSSRTMQYLIGAAAVVAVVIGGFAVFGGEPAASGEPVELTLGGDAMASCIAPEPEHLRGVELAFAGTASAVDGEQVTLAVDEWFLGGDAATVELFAHDGMEALIGGIDFVEGEAYLISAESGTVNYCGLSGEATPELQAMYDEAFSG